MPRSAVIAGGGVIGLATGVELLRRGLRVTVVDPEPGSGASRAAAGMLAPVAEVIWDQEALHPLMAESARRYPGFVERVEAASGLSCGHRVDGTLVLAGDPADREALHELLELQHRLGMGAEAITARRARRMEPSIGPGAVAAVSLPGDHQVDPRALTASMAAAVEGSPRGTVVRDRASAVEIGSDGAATGLILHDGRVLRADHVVVAAGMGSARIGGVPPEVAGALRPVHGEVIRMRVPERLRPLLDRVVRGVVRGRPVYLVPRADGALVLGATSREDEMTGVSAGGVHQLLRDAARLVPGVLECEITELISRARPGSPDDAPLIGRVAPGLTVSVGYFRHGILLTALGADLTADAVTGAGPDGRFAAAIDPLRFRR